MTPPREPRARAAVAAGGAGAALVTAGLAWASPAAHVAGTLALSVGVALLLWSRLGRWRAVAVGALVTAAAVALPLALLPRSHGVTGDWAAAAVDGRVLAGRALVAEDSTAVDLVSGRTVRLGSAPSGRRFVADERLLVVHGTRVDSVRLDASARWTWRAPEGQDVEPVAAAEGHTALRLCAEAPAPAPCSLVGVDPAGRTVWQVAAPEVGPGTEPRRAGDGSLPRVAVSAAGSGSGVYLVDTQTGRRSLQPGAGVLALPSGQVAVSSVSGGRCVTSLYAGVDPAWTRVSPQACGPGDAVPARWHAASGSLFAQRAGVWERFTVDTGARTEVSAREVPREPGPGRVAAGGLTIRYVRVPLGVNPFRDADLAFALQVRRPGERDPVARLVSGEPVEALRLDAQSLTVRAEGRIVRYTLDLPDRIGP